MSRRPYQESPEQRALLDEMSRNTDPREEAIQQLCYELENGSDITRRAFVAELLRGRALRDAARTDRRRLPPRVQRLVDAYQRAKNFEHLVALAEQRGEDLPPLDPGAPG